MVVTQSQRRILLWIIIGSLLVPMLLDTFPNVWIHFRERAAPGEIIGQIEHFFLGLVLQLSQVFRSATGILLAVWVLLRLGIFGKEEEGAPESSS